MKKNNIIKALAAVAVTAGLSACSDNYLNTQPTTSYGTEQVTATVENAEAGINGICNAMQTQYGETSFNQYNGETWVNTSCNDTFGPDFIGGLGISMWGSDNVNMVTWGNGGYVVVEMPWNYCYNLISQANVIIKGIDGATGSETRRDFVKAQALTFRAFGYMKLLNWYAPRWVDSNNGSAYCLVLRTEPGTDPVPLSTMAEALDLIYSDLNTAIELFKSSGEQRKAKWQPDLSVAYGVLARAALIKQDWATAQAAAHNAREGYKIMDNDTYLSGFCYDNDDFMWEQAADETSIYYWSWGSHYATNGIYVQNWGTGAGSISMDLARKLDPNDIRLKCFITPDKIDLMNSLGLNKGKVKEEYFWDAELVDVNNELNLATGFYNSLTKTQKSRRWGLYNFALNYIYYYYNNIYKGDQSILCNEGFWPYYTIVAKDGAQIIGTDNGNGKPQQAHLVVTPFGAQLKFISVPPYGVSNFPFMRASEMCLAEAEAACEAGDLTTARNCLMEINGKRIPGYSCASLGQNELREAIRLSRRIELWGEGQSWSDWKRWNLPLERKAWKENDVNSGNWKKADSAIIPAEPSVENNWWRMNVPNGEKDYNKAVDVSLLPW